ncbi:MAG: VanZ family protein [PVC group bacterium]
MSGNNESKTALTRPGFFHRSHKPLAAAVAVLILSYAPVARPIQFFLRTSLGPEGMMLFVLLIFLAGGVLFFSSSRLWKLPLKNIILTITVFLAGLIYSFTLRLPEERIHLVQFGLLGLLACPSLKGQASGGWRWLWKPLLFVSLVGAADEVFQWFLPDRFFDLRDILFNALGGVWGILLYMTVRGRSGEKMNIERSTHKDTVIRYQ